MKKEFFLIGRKDLFCLSLLLALIALCWCFANAKWSMESWRITNAYLEGRESDTIGMLANFRAAADGNYRVMGRKSIPELGAPEVAEWADIPVVEEIPLFLTGFLARCVGIFAALNLKLLLAHLLAGATFYLVGRYLGCSRAWAFLGGLAYGLASFLFSESPHHSIVAYAWHVPLFLVVWRWVSDDGGLALGSRRFWVAAVVAFITGLQNVYYTNIFCQLTLLAGFLAMLRCRNWRPLISAFAVIGFAALAFFMMGLDTWVYQWQNGKNPVAIERPYHWLEVYSLKPVDLLIPSPAHQVEFFRSFASFHNARTAIINEGAYLGILGIGALLWIFGLSVFRAVRKSPEPFPPELWQILWIFAAFGTGGLNSIAGIFGFTFFRAGYRAVIVIQAIALMFFAKEATRLLPAGSPLARLIVPLLACLVFLDQVPKPKTALERKAIAAQIDSDRAFTLAMEEALPEGAMVLQLPPMDFPEAPVPGITPYEHLRPYLFSSSLRYSFGGVKGRQPNPWIEPYLKGDLDAILATAKEQGFSGIMVNRRGFPDGGESLFQALSSRGIHKRLDSEAGDLSFLPLSTR